MSAVIGADFRRLDAHHLRAPALGRAPGRYGPPKNRQVPRRIAVIRISYGRTRYILVSRYDRWASGKTYRSVSAGCRYFIARVCCGWRVSRMLLRLEVWKS